MAAEMLGRRRFSNNNNDDSDASPVLRLHFGQQCTVSAYLAKITFIASITCLEAARFVVNSDHQSPVMKN